MRWRSCERSGLQLHTGSEEQISRLARSTTYVVIAGPTCSGKTSLTNRIAATYGLSQIAKVRFGELREEERRGIVPAYSTNFRDLDKAEEAVLVSTIVGIEPPYSEWDYWGNRLGIIPPTANDLMMNSDVFNRLLLCYRIKDVHNSCLEAKAKERVSRGTGIVILGLFERDAVSWKELFPNTTIFRIKVNPNVLTKRSEARWDMSDPAHRARVLDGVSTPDNIFGKDVPVLENNTPDELERNFHFICKFIEREGSRGGAATGPSAPMSINLYISYEAMYNMCQ